MNRDNKRKSTHTAPQGGARTNPQGGQTPDGQTGRKEGTFGDQTAQRTTEQANNRQGGAQATPGNANPVGYNPVDEENL